MKKTYFYEKNFLKDSVWKIAIPITLQSIFQASFSVVDQIMTGQLGSVSVAGIGLASKFASIYSVLLGAVISAAGIMVAQYVGSKNRKGIWRSLFANMGISFAIAAVFMLLSLLCPEQIMSAYSKETATIRTAASYLRIVSFGFVSMALIQLFSMLMCSTGLARLPMYGSVISIVLNVILDYILIFGKAGMPVLGADGAAWATSLSRIANALFLLGCFVYILRRKSWNWGLAEAVSEENAVRESCIGENAAEGKAAEKTVEMDCCLHKSAGEFFGVLLPILLPILFCEFFWSLGENVYAVIYGRMSTADCAAMTLLNPIQALVIGALSGLASAAGIIVGKLLGEESYEEAYARSKTLMKYGLIGSCTLSALLLVISPFYARIFQVEENVKLLTTYIMIAYAIISPVKVQNMIMGGILRSGGQTKYVLFIDLLGTWCFGVPLGLFSAFIFQLPIYWVYFILSLEECVRLTLSWFIFRKRKWMQNIS